MTLQLTETENDFRSRLGLNEVVNIQDCSRYWEVMVKPQVNLTPDDFSRLKIYKVIQNGSNKCVYIPKQ